LETRLALASLSALSLAVSLWTVVLARVSQAAVSVVQMWAVVPLALVWVWALPLALASLALLSLGAGWAVVSAPVVASVASARAAALAVASSK